MNFNDLGTDMTNPERNAIETKAYVSDKGRLLLKGAESVCETIESDMVCCIEDSGKATDDAYTRVLEGEI